MRIRAISALALLLLLSGLALADSHFSKGPAVKVGNGKAWAWVKIEDGKPVATGVSFSEKALDGLPTDLPMPDMPGMPGAMPLKEWVLELPKEIRGMPYDHVGFDWNPKGHDPMTIYGVPHFDVHFYVLSQDERKGITAMGDDLNRCMKAPEKIYIPVSYINPPGTVVPLMGNHWIDSHITRIRRQALHNDFCLRFVQRQNRVL